MTTEQKLQQIVDRLLVKTQDNLCEWRYGTDRKFKLRTNSGFIHLYSSVVLDEGIYVTLDVFGNQDVDTVLAFLKENNNNTSSNLVRLFNAVNEAYQKYVDSCIEKMISELQNQ